ncbi:MAG: hypothetical protein PHX21_13830 [bacterium]|nr:hypothetical protein [bacterium]
MNRISQLTQFQKNSPGSQTFKNSELLAIMTHAEISKWGNLYVNRDFAGCEVVVMVLRPKE